jgi:hypothetical protein
MMIHNYEKRVNTFFEQNVLVTSNAGVVANGTPARGQRSIQQTATYRAYESTELR